MAEMVQYVVPVSDADGAVVDFRSIWSNAAYRTGSRYPDGVLISEPARHIRGIDLVAECRGVLLTGIPVSAQRSWAQAPQSARDVPQRHFETTITRFADGWLMTGRELTDQVLAEQALAASQELFRSTFEDAPVAMAVLDLNPQNAGAYLAVNAEHVRMTGYSRERLMAEGWSLLTPPGQQAAGAELVADLAAGRAPSPTFVLTDLQVADGSVIRVRVGISLVTADGVPNRAIAYVEDLTTLLRAESELRRLATHDALTGLPNRAALVADLVLSSSRVGDDQDEAFGLIYAGLDHFSSVNDAFGRDAGDRALSWAGDRLKAALPGPHTVSRIAGDEFAVLAPALTGTQALDDVAHAVLRAFDQPLSLDGRELKLSASVGGTLISGPLDPDLALHQAGTAMHTAKRRGRRRVELYRPGMEHSSQRRLLIEEDLRAALEHDWLRLYYQPLVDLTVDRVVGAEALLRIEHPERGMLTPDTFIEVAEDSDLIVPIGRWVLQEACLQLQRWQQQRPMEIAVNVSGRQVSRTEVSRELLAAIAAAGVDPQWVCLEMTERVLIEANDVVDTELRALSGAGVSIAIDDFGTGYSSLSYLQQFPINTVKIDRSFVAGLGRSVRDTAIVQAVIALASALKLTVVAEGIEQPDQLAMLRGFGVQRAQGYLLGRPMPAEDLTRILQRTR
jgi:diguanylate cyclase (GGDEF)-like protein/PAS domain S-box-containing protein